nr:DNA-directed RNA polymerase subunit N [Bradyrhizobium sp.]
MIKAYAFAAMLLLLAPASALAQHRAGDAALGALAGAVVLGPVGAIAGAFVGYSAGPAISRSWGIDRPRSSRHRRHASGDGVRAARAEAIGEPRVASARAEAKGVAPRGKSNSKAFPPVQALE